MAIRQGDAIWAPHPVHGAEGEAPGHLAEWLDDDVEVTLGSELPGSLRGRVVYVMGRSEVVDASLVRACVAWRTPPVLAGDARG